MSHDGIGAGDHDLPYVFGEHPWLRMPLRQHARLLVMLSRIQDTREGFGTRYAGDLASGPSLDQFLEELNGQPPASFAA